MLKLLSSFLNDEDGATMVEYCLMVGLIALVCISTVTIVGQNTSALYANAVSKM
jgi:pilus assembly protein Flp/PilA